MQNLSNFVSPARKPYNPYCHNDRITAEDALKHAYVVKFFNHAVEDKCRTRVVHPPLDEDTQFTIEEYREKLYEIIHEQKVK